MIEGRETTNEEIRSTVEGYWQKVILKDVEEETTDTLTIYSDRKEMDSVQIEETNIDKAIKAIKLGKTGGTHGVSEDFVKYGGEKMKRAMKGMFSSILEEGEVPQGWKWSRVTLIHKGGGKAKEEIGNYRPITIRNILEKVFDMIINWKKNNKMGKTVWNLRRGAVWL